MRLGKILLKLKRRNADGKIESAWFLMILNYAIQLTRHKEENGEEG